jgi:hypothetical protein
MSQFVGNIYMEHGSVWGCQEKHFLWVFCAVDIRKSLYKPKPT